MATLQLGNYKILSNNNTKPMRIKHLLFAFVVSALAFAACEPNTPVDEVKNPTVELTAGEATQTTISFTINSTEASDVAWLVVEASEGAPTSSEVLANGTAVAANESVACTANDLKAGTDYTVVAVAKNVNGVDRKEATIKTLADNEEPEEPKADVEFTAEVINIQYYGTDYSAAYNYYVYLSDVGIDENGYMKQNGTYYLLDLYAADSAANSNYTLPGGTYQLKDNYAAGTFSSGDYGASVTIVDGVPTYKLYAEGTAVVSDGKIEMNLVMESGETHYVVYEGSLYFGSGDEPGEDPENPGETTTTHVATSWTWGGSTSYGNKYAVSGEGFSLDVHFPAQYASESELAEGDYIWTNTSWWGYNEFDNEFTTRSFIVDGAYAYIVKKGSAEVTREGDEYSVKLVLEAEEETYVIEYNGPIGDNNQGGGEDSGEEVVFTKMESLGYNSSYYFYEFKLTNDAGDALQLCVNDYQAKENFIYTDDSFEWISISYCGNLGYFSTRNIKVGGTSYTASSGSMSVLTDESTYAMVIVINVAVTAGGSKTFKFSGKVGEDAVEPEPELPVATPIALTSLGNGELLSSPECYSYAAAGDNISFDLLVNSSQSSANWIQTGEFGYAPMKTFAGSAPFFFIENLVINGVDDSAMINSKMVVAEDGGITITLYTNNGGLYEVTYSGPIGDGNTGEGGADNEGGDDNQGGETTESFENWVFTASASSFAANSTLTFTDGTHTVTCKFNQIAEYIYAGDTSGFSYAYDFTVNGEAVALEKVSGTIHLSFNTYKMTLDLVIDGVKYTGTSTNAIA